MYVIFHPSNKTWLMIYSTKNEFKILSTFDLNKATKFDNIDSALSIAIRGIDVVLEINQALLINILES